MLLGGCIQVTPQPTPTPIPTATPIPTVTPVPQGEAIFQEGFESGLEGWELSSGPGRDHYLTTETRASGEYSLKIIGGRGMVHSAGGAAFATVSRQLDYPGPSRIGLEVSFSLGPNVGSAGWALIVIDGAYRCYANLHGGNSSLAYLDANGDWQRLDPGIELNDGQWHTVKMVIDPYAKGYVWYMLDGYSYPFVSGLCQPCNVRAVSIAMSVSPLRDGCVPGTFTDPGCTVVLNSAMYIDDVIVTKNEP